MNRLTLQGCFKLWTILMLLIPSLLIMGIYTIGQIQIGKQKNLELLDQRVTSQKDLLQQWSTERMDNIRQLSQLEEFRTADYAKIKNIFFLMQQSNSNFSALCYIDKNGIFQIATISRGLQHPSLVGQRSSHGTGESTNIFSGMIIGKFSKEPIINFSYPIYSKEGSFQGRVVGSVKTSMLAALFQENWIGETGEIRLVDQAGLFLTEPRNAKALMERGVYTGSAILNVKLSDAALQNIQLGHSGTATWLDRTDKKIIATYQSMPEYGWTLIGKINEEEVFAPIYSQLIIMAGSTLVVILLFLPIGTLLTNRVKRPLDWLITEANRLAIKEDTLLTQYHPDKNIPAELIILCETFTNMNDNVQNTLRILHEKEANLEYKVQERTAELSNLNAILEEEMTKHQATNITLTHSHTELLLSEQRYKDLFYHMHAGCAYHKTLIDEHGTPFDLELQHVNHIYEQHAGLPASKLIGKRITKIFPCSKADRFDWMSALFTVGLSGKPLTFTTYSACQNRWFTISAYCPAPGYVVTIGEDVTNYQKLKQEVDRMDRLNLIGNVAAGLAHEIRNPLTVIKGYLQYFKKKLPSYLHDQCDLVLSELGHIEEIITVFLSIAKNKPSELEQHNLNDIITNLAPLLLTDARKRSMNIECKLAPELAPLLLSKKEIKQLLLNLAMNGLDAMKEHGTLTIETQQQGKEILLSITDCGCGIPKKLHQKIFDPFFTTRDNGTGLGLPVCTSIAQRHHAVIEVSSSEGKGARFTITFREPKESIKKDLPNSLFETW